MYRKHDFVNLFVLKMLGESLKGKPATEGLLHVTVYSFVFRVQM